MSFTPTYPSASRVEAFSDGVIAIIIVVPIISMLNDLQPRTLRGGADVHAKDSD